MTGRRALGWALGTGLALQMLFWGHRWPVLRWGAAGLAWISRRTEPWVGLWFARTVFLLPLALLVIAVPQVVREREGGRPIALLALAAVVGAATALLGVVLTRPA